MRSLPLLLLLAGCATADGDGADTDLADGAACVVLNDGLWNASGSCFGMRMEARLRFDEAACTFTLTEWDMEMATPNPAGGAVAERDVTLDGEDWADCTATAAGPNRFTGTCEAGCAFEFAHQ